MKSESKSHLKEQKDFEKCTLQEKIDELNQLEEDMYHVDQYQTVEDKVAEMKRHGHDPEKAYKKWDDDKEDDWD